MLLFIWLTFSWIVYLDSYLTDYWMSKRLFINNITINRSILRLYFERNNLLPNTIDVIRNTCFADVLLTDFDPTSKIQWYDPITTFSDVQSDWTLICQSFNEEAIKKGSSVRLKNNLNFDNFYNFKTK